LGKKLWLTQSTWVKINHWLAQPWSKRPGRLYSGDNNCKTRFKPVIFCVTIHLDKRTIKYGVHWRKFNHKLLQINAYKHLNRRAGKVWIFLTQFYRTNIVTIVHYNKSSSKFRLIAYWITRTVISNENGESFKLFPAKYPFDSTRHYRSMRRIGERTAKSVEKKIPWNWPTKIYLTFHLAALSGVGQKPHFHLRAYAKLND